MFRASVIKELSLRNFIVAVCFAAIGLSLGACKKDQSTTGESAQESMGLYAKGFNALIDSPMEMVKEYEDKIPEAGPPGDDQKPRLFPRQNFADNKIKEARDAFAAAKKAAPKSLEALGPVADRAIAGAEKSLKIFTDAHKYYDAEDYKDDQFAKGKALHTQMMAAIGEFRGAIRELQAGLSKVEDEQAASELTKYKQDSYGYWFRFFNQQAKKFVDTTQAAGSPEELAKLEESFKPIDAAFTGLQAFLASKNPPQATFKAYTDSAGRFHSTGKKLLRAIKEGQADGNALTQAGNSLVSDYNTLVSLANSLYELEGNDLLK